jgi:zinc/manganese transport system substrate-binding protein
VHRHRHAAASVAALCTAGALALAACDSSPPAAPAPGGPLTVVTSTNVYGSIAEAVGGPAVTVQSLISDPAADPHEYEATPAAAAKVAGAKVVVFNGGGYDDWMSKLVGAGGGSRTVIDVTDLSGLRTAANQNDVNEHVWYDLPTVRTLVTTLATDFGTADPANAATYTANAAAFTAKLNGLAARTKAIAAAHAGARVAVTEPVPGYLLAAAGLTDVTPPEFSEAIEEDTDPPAAVLQRTLALFSTDPVKALVLNAQTETPTTDQVKQAAQTAGVPVVDVTETLPAGAPDYVTWMGAEIDALAAALDNG